MTQKLCRAALVLLSGLIGLYLIIPLLIVVPMSFSDSTLISFPPKGFSLRWYENLFTLEKWTTSTQWSLQVGVLSAIVAMVFGTLGALALVRGAIPGRNAVIALMLSPMIIPFIIIGISVYIGFLDVGLTETVLGFVLVHACLGIPYVVVNVTAGLVAVNRRLEMASMVLGASPISTFFRVTLPHILPSMIAGGLFAFIISWDEVVVAIFLSGADLKTLPVQMWDGIKVQVDPTIAALSTVLLGIILVGFLLSAAGRFVQRRLVNAPSKTN